MNLNIDQWWYASTIGIHMSSIRPGTARIVTLDKWLENMPIQYHIKRSLTIQAMMSYRKIDIAVIENRNRQLQIMMSIMQMGQPNANMNIVTEDSFK
jgi:hypothetical protein